MADHSIASPLLAPSPITKPGDFDLETGPEEQIRCRICLATDGRDFVAPCKCKGNSKYVHRACLDHLRSKREGFAFTRCTTCKAPYHLRVHVIADKKWRTLKFRFFVTRDIFFIFIAVQFVIALLSYLVCLIGANQKFWDPMDDHNYNYYYYEFYFHQPDFKFYYFCGAVLFFALLGLSECFVTCYRRRLCSSLAPSRNLCQCCCHPGKCSDCHLPGTRCIDCTTCCNGCARAAGDCEILF